MKIILRTLGGEEHELDVAVDERMANIVELIQEQLGHSPADVMLMHEKKNVLDVEMATLDSLGIEDGTKMVLIIRSASKNVALGKIATQSSDYYAAGVGKPEHNGLRPASNAVDGDNDDDDFGNSKEHVVSHTKHDFEAWWEVDLGASYNIEKIDIYTRNSCIERLWPCWVLAGDTPFSGGLNDARETASHSMRLLSSDPPQRQTSLDVSWSGRYIRIQLEATNNLHLAQVEVYSRDVPS